MTAEERTTPTIIDGSRRARIANGSGTSPNQVAELVKQFSEMQKVMKRLGGVGSKKINRKNRKGKKGKKGGGRTTPKGGRTTAKKGSGNKSGTSLDDLRLPDLSELGLDESGNPQLPRLK